MPTFCGRCFTEEPHTSAYLSCFTSVLCSLQSRHSAEGQHNNSCCPAGRPSAAQSRQHRVGSRPAAALQRFKAPNDSNSCRSPVAEVLHCAALRGEHHRVLPVRQLACSSGVAGGGSACKGVSRAVVATRRLRRCQRGSREPIHIAARSTSTDRWLAGWSSRIVLDEQRRQRKVRTLGLGVDAYELEVVEDHLHQAPQVPLQERVG